MASTQGGAGRMAGGSSAGRGARRGSILVLTVGVLALVSILVVVYFSVGRADRREGATALDRVRSDDQVAQWRDYLAGVIGDDALAIERQRDRLGNDHVWRSVRTYPGVDPMARSVPGFIVNRPGFPADQPGEARARQFVATGSSDVAWPAGGAAATDPRTRFSPWLSSEGAAFVQGYLGPTDPWPADTNRPYAVPAAYQPFGDWLSVSNFAPDGRAVNLAALRGNFNAEPGIGWTPVRRPDGRDDLKPQTSATLTLRQRDGSSYPILQPTGPTDGRVNPATGQPFNAGWGLTPSRRADGLAAHLNAPADWFTSQQNAFRPLGDSQYVVGDPRRLDNQWADTDGDGVADARWFESASLRDALRSTPGIGQGGTMRVFAAARAVDLSARVNVNTAMDLGTGPSLSPLTLAGPGSGIVPVGLTPSDVDLRRLLEMTDARWDIVEGVSNAFGSTTLPVYGSYGFPPLPGVSDYTGYEPSADLIGQAAYRAMLAGRLLGAAPVGGQLTAQVGGVSGPLQTTTDPSAFMQFAGYQRESIYAAGGPLALTDGTGTPVVTMVGASRDPFAAGARYQPSLAGATPVSHVLPGGFTMADQLELIRYNGLNDATVTSRLEALADGRSSGTPEFGPLRSNRSLTAERQPAEAQDIDRLLLMDATDIRRRLTVASGARPLRATRLGTVRGGEPFTAPPLTDSELKLDVNDAMARALAPLAALEWESVYVGSIDTSLAATPRNQAVTIPLPAPASTDPYERAMALRLQAPGDESHRGIGQIFDVYFTALMPFADLTDVPGGQSIAWDANRREARALIYGSRPAPNNRNNVAEFAARTAGHLTLNLVASRAARPAFLPNAVNEEQRARQRLYESASNDVIVGTLLLNGDRQAELDDNRFSTGANARAGLPIWYPWRPIDPVDRAGNRLIDGRQRAHMPLLTARLNANDSQAAPGGFAERTRLASGATAGALSARNGAINLFGVTPQPVLTQVATFVLYTDSDNSSSANEPERVLSGDPCSILLGSVPSDGRTVRIDGSLDPRNTDFVFEIAVVQVNNPFDVAISLSGFDRQGRPFATTDEDDTGNPITVDDREFCYYIELGGRFYPLTHRERSGGGAATSRPVVLAPGESRNFVIYPRPLSELADRLNRAIISEGPRFTEADIEQWVRTQVGLTDAGLETHVRAFRTAALREVKANPGLGLIDAPRLVNLERFNPYTGEYIDLNSGTAQTERGVLAPQGFVSDSQYQSARVRYDEANRVVRLWRRLDLDPNAAPFNGGQPPADPMSPDEFTDVGLRFKPRAHVLVDRLRDPLPYDPNAQIGNATLDQRLRFTGGNTDQEVSGTLAGYSRTQLRDTAERVARDPRADIECRRRAQVILDQITRDPANWEDFIKALVRDNTGFTFVNWGIIRRPDRPRSASGAPLEVPAGAVPPWMMEVKSSMSGRGYDDANGSFRFSMWSAAPVHTRSVASGSPERREPPSRSRFNTIDGGQTSSVLEATYILEGDAGLIQRTRTEALLPPITRAQSRQPANPFSSGVGASAGSPRSVDGEPSTGGLAAYRVRDFVRVANPANPDDPANPRLTDVWVQLTFARKPLGPTGRPVSEPDNPASPLQGPDTLTGRVLPPLMASDMLRPLAVGAWNDPAAELPSTQGVDDPRNLDVQWTTLTEALALAANVDRVPDNNPEDAYYRAGHRLAIPGTLPRLLDDPSLPATPGDISTRSASTLDRGRLWTTAFVPFNDLDLSGDFEQSNGAHDPHVGLGIPFAMNVFELVRFDRFGSLASSKQGVVNLSTAPVQVLRLLPMLAPDPTSQWVLNLRTADATRLLYNPSEDVADAAATVAAYRDGQRLASRRVSNGERVTLDFRPSNDGTARAIGSYAVRARRAFTGIQGLSEALGFRSVGELLAVRRHPRSTLPDLGVFGTSALGQRIAGDVSIDRLGRFVGTSGAVLPADFMTNATVTQGYTSAPLSTSTTWGVGNPTDPGSVRVRRASGVPGGPDGELALLDAVMNSVSVRSDVFAVWFLIQGYLPGDCEGLEPFLGAGAAEFGRGDETEARFNTPLVPSLSKRFVMVVDRSNVTKPGDRPRILMFEELPR